MTGSGFCVFKKFKKPKGVKLAPSAEGSGTQTHKLPLEIFSLALEDNHRDHDAEMWKVHSLASRASRGRGPIGPLLSRHPATVTQPGHRPHTTHEVFPPHLGSCWFTRWEYTCLPPFSSLGLILPITFTLTYANRESNEGIMALETMKTSLILY